MQFLCVSVLCTTGLVVISSCWCMSGYFITKTNPTRPTPIRRSPKRARSKAFSSFPTGPNNKRNYITNSTTTTTTSNSMSWVCVSNEKPQERWLEYIVYVCLYKYIHIWTCNEHVFWKLTFSARQCAGVVVVHIRHVCSFRGFRNTNETNETYKTTTTTSMRRCCVGATSASYFVRARIPVA